jgi:hypothetical protein
MHWRLLALLLFLLLTTTPVVCVFFSFKKSIMMVILANSLRVLLCKWDTQKWRIYSARWRWPCFFVFFLPGGPSTRWLLSDLVNATSIYNSDDEQVQQDIHTTNSFLFFGRDSIAPVLSLLYLGSILVRGIIFFFFLALGFLFCSRNSGGPGGMCRASYLALLFHTTTLFLPSAMEPKSLSV